MKEIFLINSSFYKGGKYLEHCILGLRNFLGSVQEGDAIGYIPFAMEERSFDSKINAIPFFEKMGYKISFLEEYPFLGSGMFNNPKVKAIFIEGGDNYGLINTLKGTPFFNRLILEVKSGRKKYIGVNSGMLMSCPVINSNSFNLATPWGVKALGVIDFQIYPDVYNYKSTNEESKSDYARNVREYQRFWNFPVVALPRSNWIEVRDGISKMGGPSWGCVYKKNGDKSIWIPDTEYPK